MEVIEGGDGGAAGDDAGFSLPRETGVIGFKEAAIAEVDLDSIAFKADAGEVPFADFDVVPDDGRARAAALDTELLADAVADAVDGDHATGGTEVEEVVVLRVLIAPDDAGGTGGGAGGDAEFDGQVAVVAEDGIEDGQGGFVAVSRGFENVAFAGSVGVEADFELLAASGGGDDGPVGRCQPGAEGIEVDVAGCGCQKAEEHECGSGAGCHISSKFSLAR